MKRVLAIAPHPDDESFGCGGTLLKHKAQGDEIFWLVVTSGFEEQGILPEVIAKMDRQVEAVREFYGFTDSQRLKFPTTRLDTVPVGDLVAAINAYVNQIKPDSIYVNFEHDVHTDHQHVFRAAWSCCKSFRNPFIRSVWAYETLSETDHAVPTGGRGFQPNSYSDITAYMSQKKAALALYTSELEAPPFPRNLENVESLARLRGATIFVPYAEAFICLKHVF